jgi:hypothetical protein
MGRFDGRAIALFFTEGRSLLPETSRERPGTEVAELRPVGRLFVVFKEQEAREFPQELRLIRTNAEICSRSARGRPGRPARVRVRVLAPATENRGSGTLGDGKNTFKARPKPSPEPIAFEGEWLFRPEPDRVAIHYAKVKDAEAIDGEASASWVRADFDDAAWPDLWLSEAQNTLRNWHVIGPFPNEDDAGFAAVYPPETEFKTDAEYPGGGRQPVAWKKYYGDLPREEGSLTSGDTSGGPFADAAHIVEFAGPAGAGELSSTHLGPIYSPELCGPASSSRPQRGAPLARRGRFTSASAPVLGEMNDNWVNKSRSSRRGWNAVLKAGLDGSRPAAFGFTFRGGRLGKIDTGISAL